MAQPEIQINILFSAEEHLLYLYVLSLSVVISFSLISMHAIAQSPHFLCFESLITSVHSSFTTSFVSPVAEVLQLHCIHTPISDIIISVSNMQHFAKDILKGLNPPLGQSALLIIWVPEGEEKMNVL